MGLIETLYELKHGTLPDEHADNPKDCTSHNFGEWEPVDRSNTDWLGHGTEYFDWRHETETVAVKYDRNGKSDVDLSDPSIVPRDEVAEIWSKMSGQKYFLVKVCHKHMRECHCGERETAYKPVKYVAFHCGNIVAEEESREKLDRTLIEHDKQF